HPSVQQAASQVRGLSLLGREVGQWAGRQEVLMSQRGWVDSQGLPEDPELGVLVQLTGHCLRATSVFNETGASVIAGHRLICCISCGAFAWGNVRALSQACHPAQAGKGLRQQKARLLARKFPRWLSKYSGWSLGELEIPTPSDLLSLASTILAARPRPAAPSAHPVFRPGPPWRPCWTPGVLLSRFGVSFETLPFWEAQARAALGMGQDAGGAPE
ncbi:unnamed protein product, partial [Prorocentrum cordatum]